MKKLRGIYAILNFIENKIYVGASNNIKARLATHKSNLQNNKYTNHYNTLQEDYNKNSDNYQFIILECSDDDLDTLEDKYIEYYRKEGYTVFNKETNKERKIRLKNGMNRGHKKSEECKNNYKNSKHLYDHKQEILRLYNNGKSTRYIAKLYDCSHVSIANKLRQWK